MGEYDYGIKKTTKGDILKLKLNEWILLKWQLPGNAET